MLEMQQARVKCCFQLKFRLCALRESENSFFLYWNLKGVETNEWLEKRIPKKSNRLFLCDNAWPPHLVNTFVLYFQLEAKRFRRIASGVNKFCASTFHMPLKSVFCHKETWCIEPIVTGAIKFQNLRLSAKVD